MPAPIQIPKRRRSRQAESCVSMMQSLALLAETVPSFSGSANWGLWIRQTRQLEIRANALIIFREAPSPTLSNAEHVILLTRAHYPRVNKGNSVRIANLFFKFHVLRHVNAFRVAILSVIDSPEPIRYDALATIGAGSSGKVHLASRHGVPEEYVAIKTIEKRVVFASQTQLSNLIAERLSLARAAESTSPFLIRLVDAFETLLHFNFVLELASFGDLHTFLTRLPNNRVPEIICRQLFAELVLGVLDVHSLGFLFRDIKTSNILMTSTGHLRLADFGLAKAVRTMRTANSSRGEGVVLTRLRPVGRSSTFVGTRRYMAPEQLLTERSRRANYGAKADVWALGIVLCVMLTGRYPFSATNPADDNVAALTWAIVNAEFSIPCFVSGDATQLIRSMLQREETRRVDLISLLYHPWFVGVDWGSVRRRATVDDPVLEVLELVRQFDIDSITEAVHTEEESKYDYFSAFKMDCSRRQESVDGKRSSDDLSQLIGFVYNQD